jgi:hypothetical protein
MKLLREYYELCDGGVCQDYLTEAEKERVASGTTILSGVMQMSERQNGNGRVYPHAILEREVERYKEAVKGRRALGELDHPESGVVNLQNCSHLVTDIWMEGNKCMGKIEVLQTPAGKILESLILARVPCGISSRGMGSVTENNGVTMVEDDFQLICFDMVADPSTPGAYMMKEGKELKINNEKVKINNLIENILRTKL